MPVCFTCKTASRGVTTACTGLGLPHELLILCFSPLIIMLMAFLVVACQGKPLTSGLPFVLVTSFLCYPFIASRGFRALAPCDCFEYIDAGETNADGAACFLRGAYDVTCERQSSGMYAAPASIRTAAWLAVVLYAMAVPLLYMTLLFVSRKALSGATPPTALGRTLSFLCRDYKPRAFAWELVDVARKITLTGFLALVKPGSLIQLYLGVAVALCILIFQLCAPPLAHIDCAPPIATAPVSGRAVMCVCARACVLCSANRQIRRHT